VERWKEYQTELAKYIISDSGAEFPFYKDALCEWDILGQSGQKVYVWAMCYVPDIAGGRAPAVIDLDADGSIRQVKVPVHGSTMETDLQKMFPADVREKINLYFLSSSLDAGRVREMGNHLTYRLTHPNVPPLIFISTTAMP
jgi:hypothetical protein